jgi:acyl-coenzyme A synthetase/AMP-(fatty) acid ligase
MLEQLGCTLVLMPQEGSELMNSVLEHLAMEIFILPELDWFLANDSVEPFPYYKSFEEACNDTYLVLHSSGTTGTPKILVLKQGSVAALDAFQLFPSLDERPWVVSSWCGKRVVTNFPWVHAGGAYMLAMCVFVDFVPVVPAAWPFSATDGDYLHTHSNVQAAWYAPSVLIELAKDPTMLKNLGKLDSIAYSGGVIPDHVGDDIARFTTVFGIMASTETGILPCEIPPSDRWDHYRFNKRLGHEFRHFADDMYELVLSRNSDFQSFQAVFFTLSDAQTYSMRDLYIEHPTHRGWWRSAGRVDDVVIMADAKKLNVVPYEAVIEQHPAVENALICGTGQPRPAVLIQPKCWPGTKEDEYQFINTLQPQLEKANCAGPVYGRLIKELVVLAQPSKPMERAAGKDTVQRKRTLEMYESEIREIYEQAERSGLLYGEASKNGLLI